jgi:DNA repair exonuclease SbcCD ATPase subunit
VSEEEFDGEYESADGEDGKPKKKGKGKGRKANLARNKRKNMKKDEKYMTSQGEAASDEKCKEEKEKLEETYVKAYVELSRLKAEYEALSKSTACFDAINEEYDDRAPPLQEQAEKLAKLSKEAADELKQLRPRLESAIEADKKLRKQVRSLEEECKDLPETVSDLDKVRDAIRALSLCPGLYRADFKMPKFTGKLITFPQDATKQTDTEQDKAMQWACSQTFKGSRAAEFSEIEQRTVLGVPVKNESPNSLMGVCPRCAGEDDGLYKSGHARNCWAPDAPLNGDGVSSKCGKGTKSVLCVVDQSSMRKIPGEGA